jgi:XTP/dITP diphosphohydrolase
LSDNKLLLATTNAGKIAELGRLLSGRGIEVLGLGDIDCANQEPPEENGNSYCENALIKATCWQARSGLPTLADDSGLAVDWLGGAPGIYSSRFAGENATDQLNNELLLKKLEGVESADRTAAFHCCLALCGPVGQPLTFSGRADGIILSQPAGEGGFGYDPLFYYPPLKKSFAQLAPAEKNSVSHRARALQAFLSWLETATLKG